MKNVFNVEPANVQQVELEEVTLSLPVVTRLDPAAHRNDHLDVRLTTAEQRDAFKKLKEGMDQAGVRLANGKRVSSNGDVVRMLMEAIANSNGHQ